MEKLLKELLAEQARQADSTGHTFWLEIELTPEDLEEILRPLTK